MESTLPVACQSQVEIDKGTWEKGGHLEGNQRKQEQGIEENGTKKQEANE